MIGIEFVKDKATKEPDAALVGAIVQEAMNNGLMLEAAGTYSNVIRFLCPLCVTDAQLERWSAKSFENAIKTCIAK